MIGPTRRLVLAATAAGSLSLAGCKGISVLGAVPKPGADIVALEHAIAAEELMVARYRSALTALTALTAAGGHGPAGRHGRAAGAAKASAVVTAIRTAHEAHLAQLRSRLVLPAKLATASPRPSPVPPPLPSGRHRILAELAAAEHAASDRLIGWLADAPPALAQLMASIAAAEAAHVVLLGNPKAGR